MILCGLWWSCELTSSDQGHNHSTLMVTDCCLSNFYSLYIQHKEFCIYHKITIIIFIINNIFVIVTVYFINQIFSFLFFFYSHFLLCLFIFRLLTRIKWQNSKIKQEMAIVIFLLHFSRIKSCKKIPKSRPQRSHCNIRN